MFKGFKQKWKASLLVLILVFASFAPFVPIHKEAEATFMSIVEDIPRKLDKLWDKVEGYVMKALKATVFSALLNVATITTQKLAYDAAMKISGGGPGGDSLMEPMGFKEYAQKLGEQALGEFVGSLSGPWENLGLNLCSPSPLQKLDFQKSFTQDIKVNNYQVNSKYAQAPPAAKCDWNTIKKSYSDLGASLKDFSVDVDLTFDLNLKQGETVNWDSNTLAGGLKEVTEKFSSITEDLYNKQGIDLSKLWTSTKHLNRLMNESEIPLDWEDVSNLSKEIKTIRESMYKIVDDKIKILEQQSSSSATNNLAKLLYDGELSFWQDIRNKVDLGDEDDSAYKEAFNNTSRLQVLMKNKLIDKTVIMRLFSENKINNVVLKYVFLDDLVDFVKTQGDDLSNFASFLEPGKNPGSISMALDQELGKKSAELAQKATELANNQGFKNVTDIVSGRIKTPASIVQEQFKQQQIKDPSNAKWSSITGAYFNADVGTALLNVALSTFTSTVFNNLMNKVYSGIFKPDQIINQNKVTVGLSKSELAKRYASNIKSEMVNLNYQLNSYNLLDEFIVCPAKYESSNNCVIGPDWAQLLQGGENLTISEALNTGTLKSNWSLISANNALNGDKNCYQKAYCYDNLQKLRRARILPVGFEIAANLCEDPANEEYCTLEQPVTLGEVIEGFYNCGQDEDHPYSLWCNLIDPNWLLKAPAMKCRVQGYGEEIISDELSQRKELCVDDVSCISEDESGECLGWGYCTKEKNIWNLSMANKCTAVEDSCRSFTDSSGEDFSFLKNTLWITDYNTCDSENVGCAWYSRNKVYDEIANVWQWSDQKNIDNESIDRIYFNNNVSTCSEAEEGCSRVIRAIPRIGTNLIPNSSFSKYTEMTEGFYDFDYWKATSDAVLSLYDNQLLLEINSISPYDGLLMKDPIYIVPKETVRYFIYSAKLQVPAYVLDTGMDEYYNLENEWSLTVDAYKVDGLSPSNSYVYDLLGKVAVSQDDLEEKYYADIDSDMIEVELILRFAAVPDVDRLKLGLLAMSEVTNGEANQIIVDHLQLEEVSQFEINPSAYNEYNTSNLIYLKKAPDYYNCYQDWYSYRTESQCDAANGYWDIFTDICKAPMVCDSFAPYCSVNEVGCDAFSSIETDEVFDAIVESDDYCPEICAGYGRYYESISRFSDGKYINFIPETASSCSYDTVACEEYTSVADDSGIEKKEYFVFDRTCQESDASDCQVFYTWDNPDGAGAKEISRHFLKALDNEPLVSIDDTELCNEDVYNAGYEPSCYKFYAVEGGEEIDLTAGSSEFISYHLIDKTVTCSDSCKPYRLSLQVTEAQCMGNIENLNQFKATGTKTLTDGTELVVGTCTVYAILGENNSCSAVYNGCREYRGNKSNSYFTLLSDAFEDGLDTTIWTGGIIIEDSVSYEGHSLNNLNSLGGIMTASFGTYLTKDNLYLLSFWARTSLETSDILSMSLSSTDEAFTGANGLILTENWQKYTLGPIMVTEDVEEPTLMISGIVSGNLYIDSFELREITDNYYYVRDSWDTPSVCDQLPGTELMVPGYMIGCQGYRDSSAYTHYLKSFTNSCRPSAIGCELVIDTQNNFLASPMDYNSKDAKSIGDLVLPLVDDEITCLSSFNVWDKGRCYYSFLDKPIVKHQCELWGYYWLGDEITGKCQSQSVSDDVSVDIDRMIPLVVNENYLCSSTASGCSAFAKPSLDTDGNIMTCNYGEICTVASGCSCRLEESGDYVCLVKQGEDSCDMDTVYLLDNPLQYDNILCEANAAGCDEFVDSKEGVWHFRNPGQRLCEFKELRINSQLQRGWFKKGTDEPCYDTYEPRFGLWGFDHNLDYYVAGIDDLANYDFYAATCNPVADQCTNFIDPVAMASSGNRNYYYISDAAIDTSSCNGQVNLADGCVLFNNTSKSSLIYSAEKSYANNLASDFKPVSPFMGTDNEVLNPLTSYPNPYYLADIPLEEEEEVTVIGSIPYIDAVGAVQYLEYEFSGPMTESSDPSDPHRPGVGTVIATLVDDLEDAGATGVFVGGDNAGAYADGIANSSTLVDIADLTLNAENIESIYLDILKQNAEEVTDIKEENNSNLVIKVKRDRVCAEWLDSGDSQIVQSTNDSTIETSTNLIACQDFSSNSNKSQCIKPIERLPKKLDQYSYTLRGFGWDVLDYSGYSVPGMYSLDNYKQVDLSAFNNNTEKLGTVLGVDMHMHCETSSDCNSQSSNYVCVDNSCYNIYNGLDENLFSDGYEKLEQSCRAYPREDSPLPYDNEANNDLIMSGKNTCYPYTGSCINAFSNIDSGENCKSDLDCGSLEICRFNERETNNDCLCDYQKVIYEETATTLYLNGEDDQASAQGLCSGGINDGLFCSSDSDCQNNNRTDFREERDDSASFVASRCVYPKSVSKYSGLKGICLEKSESGNCITWYPVDRLVGNGDIYDNDETTAFDSNKKYYCLANTVNIPVLKQDSHNVMAVPLCPEGRFGIDTNEHLMPEDVATGRMYYLVDRKKGAMACEYADTEYRKTVLYTGAVVNVTEEKISQISQDWMDGNLDGKSGDHCLWGDGTVFDGVRQRLTNLYQNIRRSWQGDSCLYMIVDLASRYPDYFYQGENYWEESVPNTYPNVEGKSQVDSILNYPIVVVCRPDDMTAWGSLNSGKATDFVKSVENDNKLLYFAIDPFLHFASGRLARSVNDVMTEIKDIYYKNNNNCDIAFISPGGPASKESGSCSMSTEEKEAENAARELYYIVNNVCEYHDINKADYQNLYDSILLKRGDDNDETWAERKNWVLPELEHNVCSVLAQVINDDGENRAYTNRLSDYSYYKEEMKEEGVPSSIADIELIYKSFHSQGVIEALSAEQCPLDGLDQFTSSGNIGTVWKEKSGSLLEGASFVDKYISSWAKVSSLKFYDINNNLNPYPFGAVIANVLYSPYRISSEAIPYIKQSSYQYIGLKNITLETYPDDPIDDIFDGSEVNETPYYQYNDEENRYELTLTCKPESSDLSTKNQLFDLYENVYKLKSYKVDRKIMDQKRELAGIFALRPEAKYSDMEYSYNDPVYTVLNKTLDISEDSFCQIDVGADSCIFVNTGFDGIDNKMDSDNCVESRDNHNSLRSCSLDEISEGIRSAFVEANTTIVADHSFSDLLNEYYALTYNEDEKAFQGVAELGGDPVSQKIRNNNARIIMSNLAGMRWAEADYEQIIGYEPNCTWSSGFPPIMSCDWEAIYATITSARFFYGETISDNSLYSLSFYAQANKDAMPIKEIKINWGDGNSSSYSGYKFKNHLPVCNTKGPSLKHNREDFIETYFDDGKETDLYELSINTEEMNENVDSELQQGIAADPDDCVEAPFIFKHWFTDVKGHDSEGNLICNKGIPLDAEGNDPSSPNYGDVVQCMLQGSVSVTNNFGYVEVLPVSLYVRLVPISEPVYVYPAMTDKGTWKPATKYERTMTPGFFEVKEPVNKGSFFLINP